LKSLDISCDWAALARYLCLDRMARPGLKAGLLAGRLRPAKRFATRGLTA
jgi:hypothetical protein